MFYIKYLSRTYSTVCRVMICLMVLELEFIVAFTVLVVVVLMVELEVVLR